MIIIGGNSGPSRGNNQRPKSRKTAAYLSFLTGWIGGHKLYLGDTGGFIFFLILFMLSINIFGLPLTAILAFFEGMKFLNSSDQEFDRKYNGGYVQRGDPRLERRREEQMRRYENEDRSRPYDRSAPAQEPQRQRANPFKNSGLAKYKEFDLDGAIEDFNKGLDIDPNDVALNFNIACAYSLTEKKDEAYKHLAKAVSLGFNDFDRILTHDDLAFVRIQPEFDTFKQSSYRVYTGAKRAPQSTTSSTTASVSTDTPMEQVQQDTENNETLLAQLSRLAELRDKGILSEQEFLLEKKKLSRN
jgi:tetratricopeptide (TPR) repeat protein